ncbi:ribosome recycling factor [Brevibacterium sp. 50QC2O2]|jgi:ribosome recycling factor|uniref:ribosome recycling factor n=1 Tax=Brevibacterium TaxID=1696 RepID=UPI00211C93B4|nr:MULTISPECIES: ribosome recycling factor [unclassified Brevibacterium]MCQ9367761.1 ribosome recycling factor [Brevibacterium sp. 91QC2O2]MCQ9384933.1 ribosome recycling factor [Brevibacterium sp. 68QC2CO]MCQ9388020.1 ribosome recycling factor [Brevibacterium sp. 50QC2O2]
MIKETLAEAGSKMDSSIDATKDAFANVRTGRANPSLFAELPVDYYGAPTPLQQLASFQVPEARTILITPFDRTALGNIETALRNSDLGANPANDGNIIRIVLPELTEERRKEYVKIVKGDAEDGKVAIRNVRRKAKETLEKAQKDGEFGEDDLHRAVSELEDLTKQKVEAVDKLLAAKEKELLEV